MPDETPEQTKPEDTKKDTVRINLPQGFTTRVTGKAPEQPGEPEDESKKTTLRIAVPPGAAGGTQPAAAAAPEDESKKETAVMGKPAAVPKPKSDTSRVQVKAAKPTVPEMPRPTVKLRREEEAPVPAAAAAPVEVEAGPGGLVVALSVVAMLISIGVLAYLYIVTSATS